MAGGWIPRALDALGAVLEGVEAAQRRRAEQKKARAARERAELEYMRTELERTLAQTSSIGVRFAEALSRPGGADLEEMHRLNEEAQRAGLWPRK